MEKNWERQLSAALDYAGQAMKVKLGGNNPNAPATIIDDEENLVEERSTVSEHKSNAGFGNLSNLFFSISVC